MTTPAEKVIHFVSSFIPELEAGEYSAKAELSDVTTKPPGGTAAPLPGSFKSNPLTLYVAAPRSTLSPKDVHAVFPPRASLGAHENVLPHVELARGTLPWERNALANPTGAATPVPWLGLILLQEEELTDPSKVNVTRMQWNALRQALGLPWEPGDDGDAGHDEPKVPVLEVEEVFLHSILPSAEDLRWLTHARTGQGPGGQAFERAVVVCNRLPRPASRAKVHLVSLEGRFSSSTDFDWSNGQTSSRKIPLLSLYSWSFSCPGNKEFRVSPKARQRITTTAPSVTIPPSFPIDLYRGTASFEAELQSQGVIDSSTDKKVVAAILAACGVRNETFKGLMDALDLGLLRAQGPTGVAPAEPWFESGSLPLAHGMRQGGKTASWYHGPFTAAKALADDNPRGLETLVQPPENADQLLLYDTDTRMLDISYAAAWELGRLLSVGSPRISREIVEWKTTNVQTTFLKKQNQYFQYLPFTGEAPALDLPPALAPSSLDLPPALEHYLDDLRLLEGVPFHYLVPNERLLPHESLRFFHVDTVWIETLLDGALSIGQFGAGQVPAGSSGSASPRTGILLRSDLVSGWPTLRVDGFSDAACSHKLSALRFDRLGPGVLLVLFDGVVRCLEVHLPPEGLHFGFDRPDGASHPDYYKQLKDPATSSPDLSIAWQDQALRIFDPTTFASNMKSEPGLGSLDAALFAIEMLQGVPRLKISLGSTP